MTLKTRPSAKNRIAYNGQVFLAPTSSWRLAACAAARSTNFLQGEPPPEVEDPAEFVRHFFTHTFSPILWYTPSAFLSDELYDFLHRLPGIGRVIALAEPSGTLRNLDEKNLSAMLSDHRDHGRNQPFGGTEPNLLRLQSPGPAVKDWLEVQTRLRTGEPQLQAAPRGILLVTPDSPFFASALIPLAAYVRATMVFARAEWDALCEELLGCVFGDKDISEIWLAGPLAENTSTLQKAIAGRRKNTGLYDRPISIRSIHGIDHFATAERAAVLLLTYRYLDSLLTEAVSSDQGRESCFPFLSSHKMRSLHHYCNRVLDVADLIRKGDYAAVRDTAEIYWSMSEDDRGSFIKAYQELHTSDPLISDSLGVVADLADPGIDEVAYHLIDAAAFAARRCSPLLLLQRLPAETSYYIGSLMDKIDDRLNQINRLEVELLEKRNELYDAGRGVGGEFELEATDEAWSARKREIEELHRRIPGLKSDLRDHLGKTGEVLYQSLVPLAMRNTLHLLQPAYLAAFIQDPSLPVELIRESAPDCQEADASECERSWSLRYAIGHMSSVNLYETNLTSNIATFTPPARIDLEDLRVLLCSNPTRDLFFSGQEADKIARHFSEGAGENGRAAITAKRRIHLRESKSPKDRPTRTNFMTELRRGYDIVHYTGHAFFDNVLPGRSGLVLSNGVLTASDVRFTIEFRRSPIIYANACLAGRMKSVSARFTGLAAAFIRSGAAGYVSPLWSIDDRDAAALAVVYYDALLLRRFSIGQSLRAAKLAQAKSGSITWASYVLYGDPTLSIVAPDPEGAGQQEEK
jgi:hypothetical protein